MASNELKHELKCVKVIGDILKAIEYNARFKPEIAGVITADNIIFATPKEMVESYGLTETSRAAFCKTESGFELLINEDDAFLDKYLADEKELFLTISHECRHIWQEISGEYEEHLQKHKPSSDKNEYAAQYEEIDAWAWSVVMTRIKYELEPVPPVRENIQSKIYERADWIFANEILKS